MRRHVRECEYCRLYLAARWIEIAMRAARTSPVVPAEDELRAAIFGRNGRYGGEAGG